MMVRPELAAPPPPWQSENSRQTTSAGAEYCRSFAQPHFGLKANHLLASDFQKTFKTLTALEVVV